MIHNFMPNILQQRLISFCSYCFVFDLSSSSLQALAEHKPQLSGKSGGESDLEIVETRK
jgi:hypothetical protein